jgi:DNA invertase Pin-like site-specific DNA recombinase
MNAIIYAAKSTEDRHGSIPDQIAECRELAERQGWDVADEDVFSDEAFSAYSGNRGPGLEAALRRAEEIAPCVLIAQNADRIARGDGITAQHFGQVFFRLLPLGIRIWTADDGREIVDASGASSEGDRSNRDSARKSRAVKRGIRRRREERKRFHGQTPMGYSRERRIVEGKDDRYLVIDESTAPIVRRIFNEFVAGRPMLAIAKGLTNAKPPVPSKRGGKWSAAVVSDMCATPSSWVGCDSTARSSMQTIRRSSTRPRGPARRRSSPPVQRQPAASWPARASATC